MMPPPQNSIRNSGETTARFLSDFVAWMEANKSEQDGASQADGSKAAI